MELKRDIYEKLLDWKKRDSHKVLELRGARQVGKTYILNKFAQENYKTFLYINMVQTTGESCCMGAGNAAEGTAAPRRHASL